MPRVTHLELPADDPTRCIRFYERAFGWRFEKWDGGLGPRQQSGQSPTPVVGVMQFDEKAA